MGTWIHLLAMAAVLGLVIVLVVDGAPPRVSDSAPTETGSNRSGSLLINGLFEGDLKIPEEVIRRQYNIDGELDKSKEDEDDEKNDVRNKTSEYTTTNSTRSRSPRAVASDEGLWPNGIVRYVVDSSTPIDLRDTIRDAMDEWEDKTCLRFLPRYWYHSDYIYFTDDNECNRLGVCCSDSVGRKGGRQVISLPEAGCNHKGVIIHEIGHAIGFWHEQSRPDRDSYVKINTENILSGNGNYEQFKKRADKEIDYQGVKYDYDSIMHYRTNSFSACTSGCPTIEVADAGEDEYVNQGSPYIGQRSHLSDRDSLQAKRIYRCPGNGVRGKLLVKPKYGRDFPNSDEDPYVKVTAVSSTGYTVTRQSSTQWNTANPNWYEWLDFGQGRDWQFFRIRVYDDDLGTDDIISMSETVPIEDGSHYHNEHCIQTACIGSMYYDYKLEIDSNNCYPNPCKNGGTCSDLVSDYRCSCTSSWTGKNCEQMYGNLRFYVRYGSGLPDTDGWFAGDSDPYVRIYAYDYDGHYETHRTSHDQGDESPEWYEWLYFGSDNWKYFKIKVYDADVGIDDYLSTWEYVYITHGSHDDQIHDGHSGYIKYNYYFS